MTDSRSPTEITTANTTEISNRNSAGAESDSSIDLAIKEFVGAVGKGISGVGPLEMYYRTGIFCFGAI